MLNIYKLHRFNYKTLIEDGLITYLPGIDFTLQKYVKLFNQNGKLIDIDFFGQIDYQEYHKNKQQFGIGTAFNYNERTTEFAHIIQGQFTDGKMGTC